MTLISARKPLGTEYRGELRPQHLERHLAAMPDVLRQVDGGHPAVTEFPLDAVAVGEGGGEGWSMVNGVWS